MNRRQVLQSFGGMAGVSIVSACGGDKPPPPPPPTTLSLQLAATADVNPDGAGTAKPLRVRMLQLSGTTALAQADYFAIDADLPKALGAELLGVEELTLRPGQTASLNEEAKPGTRFIGALAAYYAIDQAKWRAWAPVKPNVANAYGIKFAATEVSFTGRGA